MLINIFEFSVDLSSGKENVDTVSPLAHRGVRIR